MTTDPTTFATDGHDLLVERVFAAPPDLVWRAFTEPEHLVRWWGPHGTTTVVTELDLRPGGTWRFVNTSPEGRATPFIGRYLELDPPNRLVQTFAVEAFADQTVTETTTFTATPDGGTRVATRSAFPSAEALQGAVASGMARGAAESHERLDTVLAALAATS